MYIYCAFIEYRIQNIHYENNFTVLCFSEGGQLTKLDKVPNYQPIKTSNFRGFFFFVTLRIQLAKNANKNYHVYKVIVVLHIYNKILGIRLAGHPKNRNKSVVLRLF